MLETMDSFKHLADAFSTAFLSVKTQKMETLYLLKEYLDHFDKVVMQVKSYSDDTLIQAF
ncbi:hypothetical protein TIFTF001_045851 [Ficus carica]|uniref:Uncharacterized protein n=1 Tax=Ficus carica TaxID=3494 RepID=A0AA88CN74_FICCA|nr:hypothetical protein TIFTF001_045851 [Ficus carica]